MFGRWLGVLWNQLAAARDEHRTTEQMDKYLIVGLGNPGNEYEGTRHNTGYMVLDAFAKASNICFEDKRYGFVAETTLKGRKIILLKPTTYMNLSGNAVRYWLQKENIEQSRLLVIADELALPLGTFRLKGSGSNGGHNGLGHIQQLIGQQYPRLRMGIGNEFLRGGQIDYVLGHYSEAKHISARNSFLIVFIGFWGLIKSLKGL